MTLRRHVENDDEYNKEHDSGQTAAHADHDENPLAEFVVAHSLVRTQRIGDQQTEQEAEDMREVIDLRQEEPDEEEHQQTGAHFQQYFPDLCCFDAPFEAEHLQIERGDDAVRGARRSRLSNINTAYM